MRSFMIKLFNRSRGMSAHAKNNGALRLQKYEENQLGLILTTRTVLQQSNGSKNLGHYSLALNLIHDIYDSIRDHR